MEAYPWPSACRDRCPPAHPVTGTLDVSFHRDDVGRHPIPKEFTPTFLPGDVTDATVLLVDDVLFYRALCTIKASLDELFDHGRPASVELAVLAGPRRSAGCPFQPTSWD